MKGESKINLCRKHFELRKDKSAMIGATVEVSQDLITYVDKPTHVLGSGDG